MKCYGKCSVDVCFTCFQFGSCYSVTFLFPFLPEMVLVSLRRFRFNFQITEGNVSTKVFTLSTRMHCSRMHTARFIAHLWGGSLPGRGVCLGRGVSANGGGCLGDVCPGGGVNPPF